MRLLLHKLDCVNVTGQYGVPTVSLAMCAGMTAAAVSTVVASFGTFQITANICGLPPPPKHALNRGIALKGLGTLVAGLMGACYGTTAYPQNVGFISVTKVRWLK